MKLTSRILISCIFVVSLSTSLLSVTKKEMILDALAFNGVSFGYAYIVDETPGHTLDTGMVLRMQQDGSVRRALGEFFNPFSWRLKPAAAPGGGIDPNKGVKTKFIHPGIAWLFSNYLQGKGYSAKESLITTGIAFYILEKGLQGSFETPSLQDMGSYFAGVGLSLLTHPLSDRLWNSGTTWQKILAVPLNPFIVF